MLYYKISLPALMYTEDDRQELIQLFKGRGRQGHGQMINLDDFDSNYFRKLQNNFPVSNIAVLHYTTPNAIVNDKMYKMIHRDPRPVALNIPIQNCGIGADTIFYTVDSVAERLESIGNGQYKATSYSEQPTGAVELDRFCLTMDSAMLLRTDHPHAKVQTTDAHRMFLSVTPIIGFEDFIQLLDPH